MKLSESASLVRGNGMLDRVKTISDAEKVFEILINLLEEQQNVTIEYEIEKREDRDSE